MNENKKSFFAIIPANVRYHKKLCANAKLLYGEITALCNEQGYCWANNHYFAELYQVSKVSISKWVSELEKAGFLILEIDQSSGNQRKIFLQNTHLPSQTKVNGVIKKSLRPSQRKVNDPHKEKFIHNNTINNTMNRESSALDFLKINFPTQFETFLIQHKSQIKDFEKFCLDFNDTCDQEKIEYDNRVLFGRIRKYARNWIQNQNKYNKPEEKEVIPPYLRKIS